MDRAYSLAEYLEYGADILAESFESAHSYLEEGNREIEERKSRLNERVEPHKLSKRAGTAGFIVGGSSFGVASYRAGEKLSLYMIENGGESSEELYPLAIGVGSTAFILSTFYFAYRAGKIGTLAEEKLSIRRRRIYRPKEHLLRVEGRV